MIDAPARRRPASGDPWHGWMREVGLRMRRVRDFCGLSQEQLGRAAGVSQGAISRLESGRGLQTPLVVVVKVHLALAQRLREMDRSLLSDELRRMVDSEALIVPPTGGAGADPVRLTGDEALDEIVQLYRGLTPSQRVTFRSVVRAAASALAKAAVGGD